MTRPTASAAFPGDGKALTNWIDRFGRQHQERRPVRGLRDVQADRVIGPLERAWQDVEARPRLQAAVLEGPQPVLTAPDGDATTSIWTWTVQAPAATHVLLWTNPVFDHEDVSRAEFTRLEASDLWTISLHLPNALRAAYRIAVWEGEEPPPWRTAEGRRAVVLAAMGAATADPRAEDTAVGSNGVCSSVAAGPAAPPRPWRAGEAGADDARTTRVMLPSGDSAWVYAPQQADEPTALLVLFDGEVWRHALPGMLNALTARGVLPPLHVAMLGAGTNDERWERLGVPGGQVHVVLDELLPLVREGWNVRPDGASTFVSGQSLGGIAALWTLALSGGDVGHAIAQSPSLWRFDIAEALLEAPGWSSLELQAGIFEGEMLTDSEALAQTLRDDPRTAGRPVMFTPAAAGHDWAAWQVNLVRSLIAHPALRVG